MSKRQRRANYSQEENLFLADKYEEYKDIVDAKHKDANTNKNKKAAWEAIFSQHKARFDVERSLDDLKTRLSKLKSEAKDRLLSAKKDKKAMLSVKRKPVTMPTDFSGKWTSCKSEGWDVLLGKFGVPLDKIPAEIKVTEDITQSGDQITIKTSSNVKDKIINVGTNFTDRVGPSRLEVEFTTAWEGAKLVLKRTDNLGGVSREIVGAHMVLTIEHEGTIAKTTYDKA